MSTFNFYTTRFPTLISSSLRSSVLPAGRAIAPLHRIIYFYCASNSPSFRPLASATCSDAYHYLFFQPRNTRSLPHPYWSLAGHILGSPSTKIESDSNLNDFLRILRFSAACSFRPPTDGARGSIRPRPKNVGRLVAEQTNRWRQGFHKAAAGRINLNSPEFKLLSIKLILLRQIPS